LKSQDNDSADIDICVIKSRRKTFAFKITKDQVELRAPYQATSEDIFKVIKKYESWVREKVEKEQALADKYKDVPKLSEQEIRYLYERANEYIPERVRYYADLMKVTYKGITIKKQKTRWASCSVLGNLNFNVLLMMTPPEVIDYVIVHELCHRLEMNHSKKFWDQVERVLPDFKQRKAFLKENSRLLNKLLDDDN